MNAHTNLPMTRATVESIVANRNEALRLYEQAYTAIAAADEAIKAAHAMARQAAPVETDNYTYDRIEEINAFYKAVNLPEREQFLRTARKLTDLRCWGYIVRMTDLERLMDVQAKDQLRDQMKYVPDRVDRRGQLITEDEAAKGMPPITVENIYATLDAFRADADMIFRRGIANAFSKLDRRFKSHDGFKIGSRIIVTYMFDDNGRLRWGERRETLIDVERVFAVLDGHPESSFQSTLHMLESERGCSWDARQSEHENAYFKVRCYKNGNAHLWFTRDDLVAKVNKLLAEYYGEVIADGQTAEEDIFSRRKTTLAKNFGFFPTPDAAAERLLEHVPLYREKDQQPLRILEPSAGTGNLARRLAATREGEIRHGYGEPVENWTYRARVDCVEIQPTLVAGLEAEGIYNRVICADFLTLRPQAFDPYDLIVMNPPFDLERDIDHVTHAFEFLKPGGDLFAIMSAGTEFRETKKAIAFRKLLEQMRHDRWSRWTFHELPPGSFAEVGTYVNTVIIRLHKPTM